MSINLLKKILTLLLKTKFEFAEPAKKRILFFDYSNCVIIIKKFKLKERNFNILHTRLEKINIPILIKSIIKNSLRLSLVNYYLEYLSVTKPKKVFTFIDNNIIFYKLKNKFPNIKFISIQSGHRTQYRDFFLLLKKSKNLNLRCDKIFVANHGFGKTLKKFIKCDIVPLGFFKNNFIKPKENNSLRNSLLFLSQYREHQIQRDFFLVEKKLLKFLCTFCERNNLNLSILGCSKNFQKEKKFYESFLNLKKFNFQKKLRYPMNYKLIDKFETIVSVDSTLGYESISRKKKVAIFSSRRISLNGGLERFGWPNRFKKIGFFYSSNKFKKKEAEKIMKNVVSINQDSWKKIILPKLKSISIYNYNNKPLFKELQS